MRIPLLIILAVAITLSATVGYLAGRHHSQRTLAECEARNEMLTSDLNRAVTRGVILETNLVLCKEKEKK